MSYLYSAETNAFHDPLIDHNIPDDAVPVTDELRQQILDEEYSGSMVRVPGPDGLPRTVPRQDSEATIIRRFERRVQQWLDDLAKRHGYDSIMTAVSYANEYSIPRFQEQGAAFRHLRSLVWDHCYATLDAVKRGEQPMPDIDQFIAGMPMVSIPYGEGA